MKTVVIASFAKFPNKDSNAIHLVNIGTIFSNIGYKVSFVGFGDQNTTDEFGKYFTLNVCKKRNLFSKIINHLNMDNKLLKFIKKQSPFPNILLLSACLNKRFYNKIANFCAKHHPETQLLLSITEQYTKDEFDKFSFFVKRGYKRNRYLNGEFNDYRYKMLCISHYLHQRFNKKGFNSMFLPFVFSNKYIGKIDSLNHDKINFIYSGSPHNKDQLAKMLLAFSELPDEYKKPIHLNLIGIDKKWIKEKVPSVLDKISAFSSFYGRQDYDFVREIYAISDFSILLRDNNKIFVKAGCPTKIIESLFYKVVPITNLTGDLGDYLINKKNSFIVDDCSVRSFKNALISAIDNKNKITEMKEYCHETSQKYLESSNFNKALEDFLQIK